MRFVLLLSIILTPITSVLGQLSDIDVAQDLSYYLPEGYSYNPDVPTPADIFGYEVGTWHLRPDQIHAYMKTLAASSDRVKFTEYGRTHEQRPLIMLTVSSEKNMGNLDEIRKRHRSISFPTGTEKVNLKNEPVVVWQGFSVHGNEPSGGNASVLNAYFWASVQSDETDEILENTIILVDPIINPDGFGRFAQWANSHRGMNADPNSDSREHNEMWPGGRTNHYWFDLNRDWLLLQHPESQGRMEQFNLWRPNVLTDHHEMGTNSTFFFQPGIPSRNNPLTPAKTFDLTAKIGAFHAEALDQIQSMYYSKESFDDYYYGKGSTYPDVNGAVGILFEQASSRGHIQESVHGNVSFPFTIKNQFRTALSTVKAGHSLRQELLEHQREFYKSAEDLANKDNIKGHIFGDKYDMARTRAMTKVLLQHNIEVFALTGSVSANGTEFTPDFSFYVPTKQPQYRLIKTLFENVTSFPDSLFYDISTWTFPHAFNIQAEGLDAKQTRGLGMRPVESLENVASVPEVSPSKTGWVMRWDEYFAPALTWQLMDKGILTKVLESPTTLATTTGLELFKQGSILIPAGAQTLSGDELLNEIQKNSTKYGVQIYALETGLSSDGLDFGTPSSTVLKKPEIALLVESGVTSYEIGEIWHLLDKRLDMRVTLLPKDNINARSLSSFTTLILANGNYGDISESQVSEIRKWISDGGVIVAQKSSLSWLKAQKLSALSFVESPKKDEEYVPYAEQSATRGAQVIGGAIFENRIDITHPLAYGYHKEKLAVFRNSTIMLAMPKNPAAAPFTYTASPRLSGYVSAPNLEKLKNTAGVHVSSVGSGRVIAFVDNHNFRAFWWGTNKVFLNAIFFGNTISSASTERAE